MSHGNSGLTDILQRKYNRRLYTDFKEETCLRYLYRFHTAGQLRASLASNAVEECKKIKGVEKLAAEVGRLANKRSFVKLTAVQLLGEAL